jgi:hypothetical protein
MRTSWKILPCVKYAITQSITMLVNCYSSMMHAYHMENTALRKVFNYSVYHNVGELLLLNDACVPLGYIPSCVMYAITRSISMLVNCYSLMIHVFHMENTIQRNVSNYSVNDNVGGSLLFKDICVPHGKYDPA